MSLPFQEQIVALQGQGDIYDLVVNGTFFIDNVLPQNIMSNIGDDDMQAYRQPFMQTGAGKPIVQYLKELLQDNDKHKVNALIEHYTEKLTYSKVPKLMLYSLPGFITTIATVMWAKSHLPNLEVVEIGEELHLAQESSPEIMGETMSAWLQGVEQMRAST